MKPDPFAVPDDVTPRMWPGECPVCGLALVIRNVVRVWFRKKEYFPCQGKCAEAFGEVTRAMVAGGM